jgi:hypothetical protein
MDRYTGVRDGIHRGLGRREAWHEGGLRDVIGTQKAESPLSKPTRTGRPDLVADRLTRRLGTSEVLETHYWRMDLGA